MGSSSSPAACVLPLASVVPFAGEREGVSDDNVAMWEGREHRRGWHERYS
jgi:hypothetical protein